MKIKQDFFRVRGFSATLMIRDSGETNYPKFFRYWKGTSTLEYSSYLMLNILLDENGKMKKGKRDFENDISEGFVISFFDMYALKRMVDKLEVLATSDFYREVDAGEDLGIQIEILPEFKKAITMTNSTKKNQIGFRPIVVFNRRENFHYPVIKVYINREDVGFNIPIEQFLGVVHFLKEFDLHNSSQLLLSSYFANSTLQRQVTKDFSSKVAVDEDKNE